MAVVAVGEPVVDLVAVHEQVVALGDGGQLVLHVIGQDRARGIGWIAQEERLGARRDGGFHGARVEREIVLEARGDQARHAAREDDRRHVRHVRRLVQDDLVTGVAGRPQREVQRLGGTDRDQDLGRRVVPDVVATLQVVGEGAAQLDRPVVAGVVRPALAKRFDAGLDDDPRRIEVRLADAQADDVVHRRGDVEEAPDARRRHGMHALGEHPFGQRRSADHRSTIDIAAIRSAGVGVEGSASAGRSAGSSVRQSASAVIAS